MKLAIVGTAYVGPVSETCFSALGHDVLCVDIDENKIAVLNEGAIPIYAPGLEEMVHTNVEQGRLQFTRDPPDRAPVQNSPATSASRPATPHRPEHEKVTNSAAAHVLLTGHVHNESTGFVFENTGKGLLHLCSGQLVQAPQQGKDGRPGGLMLGYLRGTSAYFLRCCALKNSEADLARRWPVSWVCKVLGRWRTMERL